MSKKDYIAMARLLRSERERIMHGGDTEEQRAVALAEWKLMTQIIIDFFYQENPEFDVDRFWDAINGIQKSKKHLHILTTLVRDDGGVIEVVD